MKLGLKIFTGGFLSLVAGWAMATPTYYGPADAPWGTSTAPSPNLGAGYYIWNNDGDTRLDWTVAFRGETPNSPFDSFWGTLDFEWLDPLTATATTGTLKWENTQDTVGITDVDAGIGSFIKFTGLSSTGFDGFNFTLDPTTSLMTFHLGSTVYDGLTLSPSSNTLGTKIWIGDEQNIPFVFVDDGRCVDIDGAYTSGTNGAFRCSDNIHQSFEIAIPEPGTLALLGLGLAGLGFSRRKAVK